MDSFSWRLKHKMTKITPPCDHDVPLPAVGWLVRLLDALVPSASLLLERHPSTWRTWSGRYTGNCLGYEVLRTLIARSYSYLSFPRIFPLGSENGPELLWTVGCRIAGSRLPLFSSRAHIPTYSTPS